MNRLAHLLASAAAAIFGFTSGVLRNARTFHPDGRVFRGTARSLDGPNEGLVRASKRLEGAVLMRIGMGLMKKGAPQWLANHIPDAPSIVTRFCFESSPGVLHLQRREGDDLDLLFTAGGDRLLKLIWNLATGGRKYGLNQFDYFRNFYYTEVPYRTDDGKLDVWLRLAPERALSGQPAAKPSNCREREEGLSEAVTSHRILRVEAQRANGGGAPFVPVLAIRIEEEIQTDQEALHFDPVAGRGFEPHGFFTELRKKVYPVSTRKRPHSSAERTAREHESLVKRIRRYFSTT